jgi:hypothetical protein
MMRADVAMTIEPPFLNIIAFSSAMTSSFFEA